ncbi:surface lipoprotein assembly modifier [Pseudocolwellia sp. AS88]|uniref:surface lipoprotein assembly modifier n=1 Tax=Pseudocolwellia sp. AS88 TaxID=3063958 RepID=UPI0026EA4110|nr:surface lipoprotein assembly modifier [Pseudocolwellia sp. AS88]MDO7085724.1 surface lipoprotein assembly modifier [Pseudocolwellia sp. AS88]
MKKFNQPLIISTLMVSAIASVVHADAVDVTWEINTGIKHDDTLTIAELDQVSEQSDVALTLQGEAKVKWQISDKLTLKSNLSYQVNDYQTYDTYDLNLAKVAFDLDYRLAGSTIGTSYYFVDAELNNDDFLQFSQNSVYWSKLYNQRYLLRFSTDYKRKEFANLTDRDATSFGVSNQHFFFFNQAKSFVSLNLNIDNENASDNQFDYRGLGVRALYSHSFVGWDHDQQIQFGWQFNKRDYEPTITEEQFSSNLESQRKDKSQVVDAQWIFEITPSWSLNTKVEYGNYDSTIESLNYDETVSSLSIKGTF